MIDETRYRAVAESRVHDCALISGSTFCHARPIFNRFRVTRKKPMSGRDCRTLLLQVCRIAPGVAALRRNDCLFNTLCEINGFGWRIHSWLREVIQCLQAINMCALQRKDVKVTIEWLGVIETLLQRRSVPMLLGNNFLVDLDDRITQVKVAYKGSDLIDVLDTHFSGDVQIRNWFDSVGCIKFVTISEFTLYMPSCLTFDEEDEVDQWSSCMPVIIHGSSDLDRMSCMSAQKHDPVLLRSGGWHQGMKYVMVEVFEQPLDVGMVAPQLCRKKVQRKLPDLHYVDLERGRLLYALLPTRTWSSTIARDEGSCRKLQGHGIVMQISNSNDNVLGCLHAGYSNVTVYHVTKEQDFALKKTVRRLREMICRTPGISVHGVLPCTTWSQWWKMNVHQHGPADEVEVPVQCKRAMLYSFIELAELALALGGHVSFEWPRCCTQWLLPMMTRFIGRHNFQTTDIAFQDTRIADAPGAPILAQWRVVSSFTIRSRDGATKTPMQKNVDPVSANIAGQDVKHDDEQSAVKIVGRGYSPKQRHTLRYCSSASSPADFFTKETFLTLCGRQADSLAELW